MVSKDFQKVDTLLWVTLLSSDPAFDGIVVVNVHLNVGVLHGDVYDWKGNDDVEGHGKHPVVVKELALGSGRVLANSGVEVVNVD